MSIVGLKCQGVDFGQLFFDGRNLDAGAFVDATIRAPAGSEIDQGGMAIPDGFFNRIPAPWLPVDAAGMPRGCARDRRLAMAPVQLHLEGKDVSAGEKEHN